MGGVTWRIAAGSQETESGKWWHKGQLELHMVTWSQKPELKTSFQKRKLCVTTSAAHFFSSWLSCREQRDAQSEAPSQIFWFEILGTTSSWLSTISLVEGRAD